MAKAVFGKVKLSLEDEAPFGLGIEQAFDELSKLSVTDLKALLDEEKQGILSELEKSEEIEKILQSLSETVLQTLQAVWEVQPSASGAGKKQNKPSYLFQFPF